jgi:hypothetical protein
MMMSQKLSGLCSADAFRLLLVLTPRTLRSMRGQVITGGVRTLLTRGSTAQGLDNRDREEAPPLARRSSGSLNRPMADV